MDAVQGLRGRVDGALVNAAALTHSSLALRDAMLAVRVPFVELHLSNIFAREPERRHSVIADLAIGLVTGFGRPELPAGAPGAGGPAPWRLTAAPSGRRALRAALAAEGLDGLLVTHLPNVRYLTGFTGSAALLLVHAQAHRAGDRLPVRGAGAGRGRATRRAVEVDQKSVWDRLGRVLVGAAPGAHRHRVPRGDGEGRRADRRARRGAGWCRWRTWWSGSGP